MFHQLFTFFNELSDQSNYQCKLLEPEANVAEYCIDYSPQENSTNVNEVIK